MKLRLLDLFCKAGGAGMGYHRAGFEVVGVDIEPQPRYPFEFHQADALEYVAQHGHEFDVIHASPPCKLSTTLWHIHKRNHPELISPTRTALLVTGKPFIIENVEGAPLQNPLMLCGTMFGLKVLRHRLFEIRPPVWFPPATCNHNGKTAPRQGRYHSLSGYDFITVAGHNFQVDDGRAAMGIDWMTRDELSQAIPPAYTEWIGRQLMNVLQATKAA